MTSTLFKVIARQNLDGIFKMTASRPMTWDEIKEQAEIADKDAFRFSCNGVFENMVNYKKRMNEWTRKWSGVGAVEEFIASQIEKEAGHTIGAEAKISVRENDMEIDEARVQKRKKDAEVTTNSKRRKD